jgi:hypothetical protein
MIGIQTWFELSINYFEPLLEPQFKKKIGRGSKPNQAGLRALV